MNPSFHRTRWLTIIIAGMTLASATMLVRHAKPASTSEGPSMSGETLVRGIYFHEGPAASLMPRHRYTPVRAASPALAALEDRIIRRLQEQDPAFFDHFANAMYSGDLVRIDNVLETTGKRIEALSDETGYAPGKIAEQKTWIWLGVGYWIAYRPDEEVRESKAALHRTMLAEAIVRQLTPAKI
jgi:hypothetical protein